ncbi:MAG TPA: endonuclease [candidate division Zixibacteria bacterium]|nr:endonuclease [candidate division Zixibacteria bacterium]
MVFLTAKQLFEELLSYYGPQNWWPGVGFEIAVGAILTQNTSWKNVEIALENLRNIDLLNPENIVACEIDLLKNMIKPSGFFNQKSQYLKNFSKFWINNSNPSRDELLQIKGIGEETADSILLYLLNKPEFVVDAYTVRISNRIGLGKSDSKQYWKEFFEKALDKDIHLFNEYHALLVIHGKEKCNKKNPNCKECFLNRKCEYGKKQNYLL